MMTLRDFVEANEGREIIRITHLQDSIIIELGDVVV